MIHVSRWSEGKPAAANPADLALAADLAPEEVVWVDLENPTPEEEEWAFRTFLPVHPLTVEDATKPRREPDQGAHLPKVEEYADYLFAVVNPLPAWAVRPTPAEEPPAEIEPNGKPHLSRVGRPQLSAVLTRRVLITHHYDKLGCVDAIRGYVARHADCGGRGPDYLFHLILDDMVDEYAPVVERIADRLDRLEGRLFVNPTPELIHRLLHVKRRVAALRKTLILEREVLARLTRGEFALVDEREVAYYRNVYDHLVRYAELIENAREMVGDLMQAHLSATSNRLNEIMKVLTTISVIGLICTFIAGVYGMNFEYMPEIHWRFGYPFALGLMVAASATAFAIFRWKKWV